MRIAEVYIKNFRGYGENNTNDGMYRFDHLDDAEVVIFSGYNGFGKTGFFEAIEWCITGKIKGLHNTVYEKNTMKKSSYLKFQSTKQKRDREIVVCIVFDNGWGIIRRTKCDSLDVHNYFDIATDLNEKEIKQEDIDIILKQGTGQTPEQILRLSFNGQNKNTDFVKSTKAKDRTSSLLEFMGLKFLDDIVKESDSKNRKKLKSRYELFQHEYDNLIKEIERIDNVFQSNKWGTIKQYEEKIISLMLELNSFQEALVHTGLRHNLPLSSDTLNSLIDSFSKIKLLKENLEQQKSEVLNCITEAAKYRLQYELFQIERFLNGANLLQETDSKQLQQQKKYLGSLQDTYRRGIDQLRLIKQNTEINVLIPKPISDNTEIGITNNEKRQYETYIAILKKIEIDGNQFSDIGNYDYNEYDIEREMRRSEKYVGFLKNYENALIMKKQYIKKVQGIYTEQKELLLQVQSFVNKQSEIDSCPVCGGTEFIKDGQKGKDELLALLSAKIADGNLDLKEKNDELVKQEQRLLYFKEKVNISIRDKYQMHLENLKKEIKRIKDYIFQECDVRIRCNEEALYKCGTQMSMISSKINTIDDFARMYQFDSGELDDLIKKKENQKSKIERVLRLKFQTDGIKDFVRADEKKQIMSFFRKRNLLYKILGCISTILEYDIGTENQYILLQYEEKCRKQEKLKNKVLLLEDAIGFRKIINENSKELKNNFLETMIENNQMINWIYGKINPHPYFRELNLKILKEETSILAAEDNDIYLDNIFSEAQMNVLSLSIFLGLILSIKNYNFEQIFLDDPVQSLDDINVVSFIDLVRALIRSRHINKNYIISTHDHNFSKLLKIKLRNYSFVEYSFISYGEEGPKIDAIRNLTEGRTR